MAVKNFPTREILFQLARTQTVRTVLFAGLSHVNDGNQDAAGRDTSLGRLEKISLQVVTNRDEVPLGRLDLEFTFFEIGDDCVDLQAALHGAGPQNFSARIRAVHIPALPTLFPNPQSLSPPPPTKLPPLPPPP